MNISSTFIPVTGIIFLAGFAYIVTSDNIHDHQAKAVIEASTAPQTGSEKVLPATLEKEKSFQIVKELRSISEMKPHKSINAIAPKVENIAWCILNTVTVTDTIQLDEKNQNKKPITFNTAETAAVSLGDIITLPLPEAKHYKAVVDYVSVNMDGDTSWSGYIDGFKTGYPVIFTIGSTKSSATITTPQGLYIMEAVNSSGWLYKAQALTDLVHPSQRNRLVAGD